jgi:predicted outer membrane repeat protein
MSVNGCVISSNSSSGIFTVGALVVTGSTISKNGSCGINSGYPGAVTLINSTVWGNSGGGVWGGDGTPLTLNNCTVSQNTSSSSGGGIYSDVGGILGGTVTLNNTIVSFNSSSSGPDIAGSVTANYCLIGDPSGATISSTTTNQIGTHATPLDPQIAWLGSAYGGPTMPDGTTMLTAPPLAGSPAIDAGNNSLAVDASTNALTTDQRGLPRIANGSVDIGACEYQQPVAIGINKQGTNVVLSWPTSAVGFRLWATNNLKPNLPSTSWTSNSILPTIVDGTNYVTNSISDERMFFRLMHP